MLWLCGCLVKVGFGVGIWLAVILRVGYAAGGRCGYGRRDWMLRIPAPCLRRDMLRKNDGLVGYDGGFVGGVFGARYGVWRLGLRGLAAA